MSIKNKPKREIDELLSVNGPELVSLVGASLPAGAITAKEVAEQARRQSEIRFQALANTVPSIVWTAAPDGSMTYASDQWFAYCGITPEQNARWPEVVLHPDDYDRCLEAWNRAVREGTDYEVEVRNRRYDGEYRWFLTRAVPVRDASGLITAWYGTSTDIHERKRTEEALKAAANRYRGFVEGLGVAVYTTDASGYITFFNEAAVELWGRRPKLGEDLWCGSWRLYWPDGRPMPHNECPMAITLKENRPVRGVEAVAERPDGTRVAFQPYPTPLRDDSGNLIGAVNVLVDITERKQAEEAALRLASIVESSDDAIVSKDLNGMITSWNPAAERIFGYTAAEAVGSSIHLIIPPERRHEEDEVLARVRSAERVDHFETVRRRKDGTDINISLTVSPIKDRTGRVIGASKIARDITERKQAEEALRESRERLTMELAAMQRLQETSSQLIRENNAEALYEQILDASVAIMRSDMASMQTVDEAHDALRMLSWRGFGPEFGTIFALNGPDTKTSCSVARRVGHRVVVPDVEMCDFIVGTPALEDHLKTGIRAVQSTPLISRSGKLLGMISTHWRQPHQPAESDLRVLDVLARQAADLIERAQAEEALRYSERRYRGLIEAVDIAVYTTDAEGRIMLFNEAAVDLWGRRPEVGKDLWCGSWRLYWPDRTPMRHDKCPMAICLKENRPVRGTEAILEKPDGSRVNFVPYPTPLRDASGTLIGAVNVLIDITERKQAEERLALYAKIFTNSQEGVAITDAQGRYIEQNPAHAALLGYADDELLGKSPTLHMSEDALAHMVDALQKAGVFRGEVVSQTKRGESLTLEVSAFPMRDENGEITSYVGIKRDTTARRLAEERLALYAEIFTNSNEAIAIIDAQARYMEQNEAHAKLLGYKNEELAGKTPAIHLGDETFQRIAKELQRTGVYQGEVVSHTKHGESLTIDLSAFAMRDEKGEITSYVGIKRNITERKRVEALKDQFLSLVSHELRTPIATVLGNALLLLKRGDSLEPEDKQRALGDVVSEAEKLQRIIENLLLLTRMQAEQETGFEPVMLGPVVGEAVEAFNRRAPDRRVSAVIEPGVPFFLGLGTLVTLVLENLLSNAHKYSPDGAPIEIHVRKNEDGEPEVRVRDYGIGLDELDLENLFTPFYRSSRAKVHAKGMGLGLAVCKRVVEAQKGKIWARNRPEGGADFVFSLQAIE